MADSNTYRTTMCKWIRQFNKCPFGLDCNHSHGEGATDETMANDRHRWFKQTQICNSWLAGEPCALEGCNYAHSELELNAGCAQLHHGPRGLRMNAVTLAKLATIRAEEIIPVPAVVQNIAVEQLMARLAEMEVRLEKVEVSHEETNVQLQKAIEANQMLNVHLNAIIAVSTFATNAAWQ